MNDEADGQVFEFAGFVLDPRRRRLTAPTGETVALKPRVLDVLTALVARPGEIRSKQALLDAVWPDTIVEENNLNQAISALRRALDDSRDEPRFIATIPGRGYQFVTEVVARHAASPGPSTIARSDVPAAPAAVAPPRAPSPGLERAIASIASLAGRPGTPRATAPPLAGLSRRTLIATASAVAGVAGIGSAATLLQTSHPVAVEPLTLAVLPFDTVSAIGTPDYIAAGLSRDVRNRLSRVRGLRVIADTSSFALNAKALGAEESGRRLGADLLVGGGVREDDDGLHVAVELIDARDGAIAWTHDYRGSAGSLAEAEASVSGALLEHLVELLGPERVQVLAPPRPADGESYRLLLDARRKLGVLRQVLAEDEESGYALADEINRLVDAVLERDPENADALVGRAELTTFAGTRDTAAERLTIFERRARGAEYLRRALRSDPDNPGALSSLAEFYRRYEWRWEESDRLFQRALAIDPNHADAHMSYSYFHTTVGDGVAALEHARTSVWVDPEVAPRRLAVARALKSLGLFAEADRIYLAVFEQTPGDLFILREIYLGLLSRRETDGLRELARRTKDDIWGGAPTAGVTEALARIEAAADAVEGDPEPLLATVEADAAAYGVLDKTVPPRRQGRLTTDFVWTLAVEADAARATERAIDLYEQAIAGRSLYIPENFPRGPYEFSSEVRAHPRYAAVWVRDAALSELADRRLANLRERRMSGVLPDGRAVRAESVDLEGLLPEVS